MLELRDMGAMCESARAVRRGSMICVDRLETGRQRWIGMGWIGWMEC